VRESIFGRIPGVSPNPSQVAYLYDWLAVKVLWPGIYQRLGQDARTLLGRRRLVNQPADIVRVARQIGVARPAVTLTTTVEVVVVRVGRIRVCCRTVALHGFHVYWESRFRVEDGVIIW
jgi:hypothetical protein